MSIICKFIDFILRRKSSPLSHRENKMSVKSIFQIFHRVLLNIYIENGYEKCVNFTSRWLSHCQSSSITISCNLERMSQNARKLGPFLESPGNQINIQIQI